MVTQQQLNSTKRYLHEKIKEIKYRLKIEENWSRIKRQTSSTSSDNEWYNEWQQMIASKIKCFKLQNKTKV